MNKQGRPYRCPWQPHVLEREPTETETVSAVHCDQSVKMIKQSTVTEETGWLR